ncbi:MAG: AtpZ/AtpI family protein [Anaerolineae bacterium]|jgi:ATP synthase protein I
MTNKRSKWGDVAWVLAISAQGGLMVALPVVGGLALGYWLDKHFGTLPWITLALVLIGAMSGPVVLYRWVLSVVKQREERKDEENSSS